MSITNDPDRPLLPLVIVGHVDHGKSTLIGRLLYDTGSLPDGVLDELRAVCAALGSDIATSTNTGTDIRDADIEFAYVLDHLEQEREERVTVDTTQRHFRTDTRDYLIIDAPGHREFTRNMISGASQAQAALLVVDATAGIRQQTRRHASIIQLLGIRHVLVAVNKMDLVLATEGVTDHGRARFEALAHEVDAYLATLAIRPVAVVPVAARTGANIATRDPALDWYDGPTLLAALERLPVSAATRHTRPLRLPVQDRYALDADPAPAEVIVGRIEAGAVAARDQLLVLPDGYTTTVDRLVGFPPRTQQHAVAGESIGLVLTTDQKGASPPGRGSVLCAPPPATIPILSRRVLVTVYWLAAAPLACGARLNLRCATQTVPCTLARIHKRVDSATLELLETDATALVEHDLGTVDIVCDRPIVAEVFASATAPVLGRVVVQTAEHQAAGAGIIIELEAGD